jgi:acetyl-CoA carboxylase biotin carboxyl carrier protein
VSLTAADVAEIMRIVEQCGFDEFALEMDGLKLNLRRGAAAAAPRDATEPAPAAASFDRGPTAPVDVAAKAPGLGPQPSQPVQSDPIVADPSAHEVISPVLGTFYRAPKPGAPPFVEVGVQVEEQTVVAIIEVMKLMNTVRAGVRGTVTEILVADGALTEFGQTLMRVRRAG